MCTVVYKRSHVIDSWVGFVVRVEGVNDIGIPGRHTYMMPIRCRANEDRIGTVGSLDEEAPGGLPQLLLHLSHCDRLQTPKLMIEYRV